LSPVYCLRQNDSIHVCLYLSVMEVADRQIQTHNSKATSRSGLRDDGAVPVTLQGIATLQGDTQMLHLEQDRACLSCCIGDATCQLLEKVHRRLCDSAEW